MGKNRIASAEDKQAQIDRKQSSESQKHAPAKKEKVVEKPTEKVAPKKSAPVEHEAPIEKVEKAVAKPTKAPEAAPTKPAKQSKPVEQKKPKSDAPAHNKEPVQNKPAAKPQPSTQSRYKAPKQEPAAVNKFKFEAPKAQKQNPNKTEQLEKLAKERAQAPKRIPSPKLEKQLSKKEVNQYEQHQHIMEKDIGTQDVDHHTERAFERESVHRS